MKTLTKQRITGLLLCLAPMAAYFALALFVGMFAGIILLAAGGGDVSSMDTLMNHPLLGMIDQFCMGLGALAGVLIVRLRNRTSFKKVLTFKNFDWSVPIMLLIFGWCAGELVDHFGGLILSNFMTVPPNERDLSGITGFISACILAPLVEELLFRYCGTEFLRGAYPTWLISLLGGLMFAAVHFYNIQGFVNVFIGGVTAAYVYCKTRNIWYTIIEHALHNALCLLPIYEGIYYEKNGFVLSTWWWLAINAVLLVISIVWYVKYFRKKYTDDLFAVNPETGLPAPEFELKKNTNPTIPYQYNTENTAQ